jgi:hypothetical protein
MNQLLLASTLVLIRPAFLHHFGRMMNFTLIAIV